MKKSRKPDFLHVKIAGGATAQCLGLMNAIYAGNKLGLNFKISYYPYSTGTYWPFAIKFLLNDDEVLNLGVGTKGLANDPNLETGKIIKMHPLFHKKFSYEKLLSLLRLLKLDAKLMLLRRELSIESSPAKLIQINRYFKTISGGFAQINESNVNKEITSRFQKVNKQSPFANSRNNQNLTVIHYRLGDKRATPSQMKKTKDFNTDLIIDPMTYIEVFSLIDDLDPENIFVVSDEPNIAQRLLAGVGIKAKLNPTMGNIWDDLSFMAKARVFIGTKSQVSQLANICVESNGGKSFMLNFSRHDNYDGFKNTTYLASKFLEPEHEIYSLDFRLEKNAHSAYSNDKNNL